MHCKNCKHVYKSSHRGGLICTKIDSQNFVTKRYDYRAFWANGTGGELMVSPDFGCLLFESNPAQKTRGVLDLLIAISEMTDESNPDSYRNDDPHRCLETINRVVNQALGKE